MHWIFILWQEKQRHIFDSQTCKDPVPLTLSNTCQHWPLLYQLCSGRFLVSGWRASSNEILTQGLHHQFHYLWDQALQDNGISVQSIYTLPMKLAYTTPSWEKWDFCMHLQCSQSKHQLSCGSMWCRASLNLCVLKQRKRERHLSLLNICLSSVLWVKCINFQWLLIRQRWYCSRLKWLIAALKVYLNYQQEQESPGKSKFQQIVIIEFLILKFKKLIIIKTEELPENHLLI